MWMTRKLKNKTRKNSFYSYVLFVSCYAYENLFNKKTVLFCGTGSEMSNKLTQFGLDDFCLGQLCLKLTDSFTDIFFSELKSIEIYKSEHMERD